MLNSVWGATNVIEIEVVYHSLTTGCLDFDDHRLSPMAGAEWIGYFMQDMLGSLLDPAYDKRRSARSARAAEMNHGLP